MRAGRVCGVLVVAVLGSIVAVPSAHATSIALPLDNSWVSISDAMRAGQYFTCTAGFPSCAGTGVDALADATTWTWNSVFPVRFDITDWSVATDQFEVYDGTTLVASVTGGTQWQSIAGCNHALGVNAPGDSSCGNFLTTDQSFASPFLAHASLIFAPGAHAIAIRDTTIPFTADGSGNATTTAFMNGTVAFRATPVPEPASLLLLGAGLFGSASWRRRRKKPTA